MDRRASDVFSQVGLWHETTI